MKKTITLLSLSLSMLSIHAQVSVADFENLVLAADTFYEDHNSASWQTSNATFRYTWETQFGGYWDAGFAYTNKNNITNGTYTNLYGAITGKGYNNSNYYVTASQGYAGEKMRIRLAPSQKSVIGFYVTNTTYGYKTMKNGGGPARAFGDTLHTHSGMAPGDYPDWFKLTVYGYQNGVKKSDTVVFYLADYRFTNNTNDYIVDTWKWVNCTSLGQVDSISFKLYSSDVGSFGINNPTYFSIDNFTTTDLIITGIAQNNEGLTASFSPNPFNAYAILKLGSYPEKPVSIVIRDIAGKVMHREEVSTAETQLDLSAMSPSIYFLEICSGDERRIKKIIKN